MSADSTERNGIDLEKGRRMKLDSEAMVRARSLGGFIECLTELGGDPEIVLRRAGLREQDLDLPEAWISFRSVLEAYNQAASTLDDPSFGLKLGARSDLSYLGPIALLARYAQTPRQALEDVVRFISIQNTGLSIELHGSGQLVQFSVHLKNGLRDAADSWMEDSLVRVCQFLHKLTGTDDSVNAAKQVLVRHRVRSLEEMKQLSCGAMVLDGQAQDAVVFDAAGLDARSDVADEEARMLFASALQERELNGSGELIGAVNLLLETLVPMQMARLEVVADQLSVHPRTLQRSLKKSGHAFSELLESQKRRIAERLLSRNELPLVDIAYYIGYSDQSAFNHAFYRWHQCSPSSWRQRAVQSH